MNAINLPDSVATFYFKPPSRTYRHFYTQPLRVGERKKNRAEVIHLATGFLVGYPPCPHIRQFKSFIESVYGLPVMIGTHPIPQKYMDARGNLPFWEDLNIPELAKPLLEEACEIKVAYN